MPVHGADDREKNMETGLAVLFGEIVSMEGFGASAPGDVLFKHFGFTAANVAAKVESVIAANKC